MIRDNEREEEERNKHFVFNTPSYTSVNMMTTDGKNNDLDKFEICANHRIYSPQGQI